MRKRLTGRAIRHAVASVVACAIIATFAAVAGAGGSHASSASSQYHGQLKVTLCHHTGSTTNPFVTITVGEPAVPAHLRHGDTIGPCPTTGSAPSAASDNQFAVRHKRSHRGTRALETPDRAGTVHSQPIKPAGSDIKRTHRTTHKRSGTEKPAAPISAAAPVSTVAQPMPNQPTSRDSHSSDGQPTHPSLPTPSSQGGEGGHGNSGAAPGHSGEGQGNGAGHSK